VKHTNIRVEVQYSTCRNTIKDFERFDELMVFFVVVVVVVFIVLFVKHKLLIYNFS